jgi:hypothetical protein
MQIQQENGRKRLTLDVFQEKAVGTSQESEQAGNAATSWICVSIIVVSIIITPSSDSSRCCSSSDCHSA